MSVPRRDIDYGSFLPEEQLKSDGSNFPDWYQLLRTVLMQNDLLYVIQEPLGDPPKMTPMRMNMMNGVIVVTMPYRSRP